MYLAARGCDIFEIELSRQLQPFHSRDLRARWWSITTLDLLSLCCPRSPATLPYGRAVFLRKVGRILRQGSELRENAIVGALIAALSRLLPYSAAGHAGAMHFKGCIQKTAAHPQVTLKPMAFRFGLATANAKPIAAPTAAPEPTSAEPTDQIGLIDKAAEAHRSVRCQRPRCPISPLKRRYRRKESEGHGRGDASGSGVCLI